MVINKDRDQAALYAFQVIDIFSEKYVEDFLNQPRWEKLYPDFMAKWKSSDPLVKRRVLFNKDVLLVMARECECDTAFYAHEDGRTLYAGGHNSKPFVTHEDGTIKDRDGVTKITLEQAMLDYGMDAVWIAWEYGYSHKGERDKYRY